MLRLKELRMNKGLSMAKVAQELCIPYTTYVNYEKGVREPNSEMLLALSDYFQVSIDFLIGRANRAGDSMADCSLSTAVPLRTVTLRPDEAALLGSYNKLNDIGKEKAAEYVADLSGNKKYTAAEDMGRMSS